MFKPILLLFSLLAISAFSRAQDNKEKADSIAYAAIDLMDNNEPVKAIGLLKRSIQLNPVDSFSYEYEIAIAHQMNDDHESAINILERLSYNSKANDRVFQQLGNSYDISGKVELALLTYNRGLEKFPNSGCIYLELGNVQSIRKRYDDAIEYYEKGIEKDPMFASNYYRAAQIFLASDEEVWGMMYGEIFMNLERNSDRTRNMSKLLFDTYKSEIKQTDDTSMSISFSKAGNTITVAQARGEERMPFSTFVYEAGMLTAAAMSGTLDYEGLVRTRGGFLDYYQESKWDEKYDNVLMKYQAKIKDAGHFDAYNHWILLAGDNGGFNGWYEDHKKEYEDFAEWFVKHPMEINDKNVFLRRKFL